MAWPEPDNKPVINKKKEKSVKDKPVKENAAEETLSVGKETNTKKREKDPMEGVTLLMVLERLESKYGWKELASRIRINCFAKDPSIKSSLKFLRRTPWARKKVEELYLESDWD